MIAGRFEAAINSTARRISSSGGRLGIDACTATACNAVGLARQLLHVSRDRDRDGLLRGQSLIESAAEIDHESIGRAHSCHGNADRFEYGRLVNVLIVP